MNKLSIDVWFVRIGPYSNYLKIWNLRVQKNKKQNKILNIEKITFKVVQMKSLAMHIHSQKQFFDIFTVGNLQNIFMEHDFWHKRKINHFDAYNVLLTIATNIPV